MKNLRLVGILLFCVLGFHLSHGQVTKANKKAAKIAEIKHLINTGSYIFKATYAIPMSMAARSLNADYDVTVIPDKLEVYLPYFGRAYAAPRDPNDGGFKLTTTKFVYTLTNNKKDGWDIVIKPKENDINTVKDIQLLRLHVSTDGYANLNVTSTNRQPITFNGYVEDIKKDK